MNKAIDFLNERGYKTFSNLNFATKHGINYYIGVNNITKTAAIAAMIEDDDIYMLNKPCLREMTETAKTAGIEKVILFTNYGLEINSQHETIKTVGLDNLTKTSFE